MAPTATAAHRPPAPTADPARRPALPGDAAGDAAGGVDGGVDGWEVTWVCGPDAGGRTVLAPGAWFVGRSGLAAVRVDDPSVEPFHLDLHLPDDPDATPSWIQLAGRRPVEALAPHRVRVGAGVVEVRRHDPAVSPREVPVVPPAAGTRVVRTPRSAPPPSVGAASPTRPPELVPGGADGVRERPDPVTGLLPAAVTCGATIAMSVALGQPLLAAMAAIGVVVAVTLWAVGWIRHRRDVRRHERRLGVLAEAHRRAEEHRCIRVADDRRRAHPGVVGARRVLERAPLDVWQRRPGHGDAFTVVLGHGTAPVRTGDVVTLLDDVPLVVDAGPGARIACCGPWAAGCVRSLLVQLAATTGPADWQLLVVTDHRRRWTWLDGLPHLLVADDGGATHDDDALGLAGASGAGLAAGRHLLVVTDDQDAVAVRTSALRRLLHARAHAALVVLVDPSPGRVPALCTTVVRTSADGGVRIDTTDTANATDTADTAGTGTRGAGDGRDPAAGAVRGSVTGIGHRAAVDAVATLATLVDPEVPSGDDRSLPAGVVLDEALASRGVVLERAALVERWRRVGPDASLRTPIGAAGDGLVELDLVADGPHGLVAGTTGSGKSELLRTLVIASCAVAPPDQLAFVLVDFKGGATFDDLQGLPHVVGVVTDLEPHLVERVVRSLRAEVTAREHLLRTIGAADLPAARAATGTPVVPRLVVVVDEFAALALDHRDVLHTLVDVARRGRSLGVHLVLATQRPSGVVDEEIRANTALRIALRLHDAAEAMDVVGDPTPATFRRSSAGRAVVRLGPGELVTFQTACAADVGAAVREIAAAAVLADRRPPRRPWCDPLPPVLDAPPPRSGSDCGPVLGLADLPDEQRHAAFTWRHGSGHLLVIGAPGTGVTTALASAAVRATLAAGRDPAHDDPPTMPPAPRAGVPPELLVLDAGGDPAWDAVEGFGPCAGVVRLHERERLERALRRAVSAVPPGGRLVVVDGVAAFRRELEQPGRADDHDRWETLLLATPPGVTLLLGEHGANGLSPAVVSRCAHRWLLHLHDTADAGVVGRRVGDVPPAVPGRICDATTGVHVQLLGWPGEQLSTPTGTEVPRIEVLPEVVAASCLPASSVAGHVWTVVLGVEHRTLGPAVLEVPAGEPVVVIGPSRSGRSGVLERFRRAWSEARPEAAQVVVRPRPLPPSARAGAVREAVDDVVAALGHGRPVLLVMDDAELVPDADGALGRLLVAPPDDLVVVVACRPDSLRAHGQWTAALRRCRRAVVMSACGDLDADPLGVVLPRHAPLAPRVGLAWLVAEGDVALAQVASVGPTPA